jgi:hypothetical protein
MDESMREDLVAIDRALGRVPIPAELEARVLRSRAPERATWPWVVVGVAAAVVLAVVAWPRPAVTPVPAVAHGGAPPPAAAARGPEAPAAAPAAATRWDGRLRLDPGCEARGDEVLAVAPGCRVVLREPALAVEVLDDAELRAAPQGLAVQRGVVLVSVEHLDDPHVPVRVEVGGGTIEVTGTRFVISQAEQTGYVHLLEGSIHFVPNRGARVDAVIGEPLAWDLDGVVVFGATAASPGPAPAPGPRPHPRLPTHPGPDAGPAPTGQADLDALLDEVAALRRVGEHRKAVTRLRRAREQAHEASVREVLSFEEGTLRERYEADPAICSYWRGHLARFPGGRYEASIARRMTDRQCPRPVEPDPP